MLHHVPDSVSQLILHTGNMLYYTDVTKQVNMVATEQVNIDHYSEKGEQFVMPCILITNMV